MIGGNGQILGAPMQPQSQSSGSMPMPYQQPQQGAYNPFAAAFAPQQTQNPYAAALAPLMAAQTGATNPSTAAAPYTMQNVAGQAPTPAYSGQSVAALIAALNKNSGTPSQMPVYQQPQAVTDALNAPIAAAAAAKAAAATAPAAAAPDDMERRTSSGAEGGA